MRQSATKALLTAIGLVLCASPPTAGAQIAFGPCTHYPSLECGSLDVPLDRSAKLPGMIRLAAVRRRAGAQPTQSAVVTLAGGPGQAATPLVREFTAIMLPALASRDLLVFDQRGTGASTGLSCALRGRSLSGAAARCALQLGARRGQFTTAASVEDLEALRAAAGYEKLVIYGVSYGTKVAMDYASRHPERVESLVLDSPVPQSGPDTLQRSTFMAMRRVLGELCADGACSGISQNPVAELAGQVRRLARGPLRGRLIAANGRRQPAAVYRTDLLNILVAGDVNPTLRAELPAAVTSARRGDSAPLVRLAARAGGVIDRGAGGPVTEAFSDTVFAATLCEEGLFPWSRDAGRAARAQQARAAVRAAGEAAFFPFEGASALRTDIIELCIGWPVQTPPPAQTPPPPAVPVLIVNGATDLRTPREDAEEIAAALPGSQLLSIPHTGHSALASDRSATACGGRAVRQFFAAVPVTPCEPGAQPFAPVPVAPTRFGQLPGTGSGDRVGRSITAALLTATDVRRQVIGDLLELGRFPRRDGGLRGGRVTVSSSGRMRLHDVVYVPGVTISGRLPFDPGGTATLRIGGSRAAGGQITVTPRIITGRVGGRRVRLAAAAAASGVPREAAVSVAALLRGFRLRHAG
jgi:pimeloyl-ACP methyl ester carboxylesterase